jgi:hypothetical protein
MIRSYSDHAANERTFLAWARTGLSAVALGIIVEKGSLLALAISDTSSPMLAGQRAGISWRLWWTCPCRNGYRSDFWCEPSLRLDRAPHRRSGDPYCRHRSIGVGVVTPSTRTEHVRGPSARSRFGFQRQLVLV